MEATEKIISIMTRWLRCDSPWRDKTQSEEPQELAPYPFWGKIPGSFIHLSLS